MLGEILGIIAGWLNFYVKGYENQKGREVIIFLGYEDD